MAIFVAVGVSSALLSASMRTAAISAAPPDRCPEVLVVLSAAVVVCWPCCLERTRGVVIDGSHRRAELPPVLEEWPPLVMSPGVVCCCCGVFLGSPALALVTGAHASATWPGLT